MERHDQEVLYCMTLDDMSVRLWGNVLQTNMHTPRPVEEDLLDTIAKLKADNQARQSQARIVELAPGILATFSTDENTARQTVLDTRSQ
jgi:hypothetical protein